MYSYLPRGSRGEVKPYQGPPNRGVTPKTKDEEEGNMTSPSPCCFWKIDRAGEGKTDQRINVALPGDREMRGSRKHTTLRIFCRSLYVWVRHCEKGRISTTTDRLHRGGITTSIL